MSMFKVGDRVRITGRGNTTDWNGEGNMANTIGQVGKIIGVFGDHYDITFGANWNYYSSIRTFWSYQHNNVEKPNYVPEELFVL